ncbi:A-kinase anchor protein 7-like phosphoesterase domain-containing protein [Madurella fahalii]|uniref:A-kinase anchor protein 7-like phosphoesterase domain-containing protein n=1 Tax=Madurella fahalii TaxID=1157608 RepID=A0ABQ0G5C3_9PEZI
MPPKPRPPVPTHFLCIPLVSPVSRPQLSASLAAFRADVCSPSPANGFGGDGDAALLPLIPEDAVRPVGTLHLTLGVFSFPPLGKGEFGDGGPGTAGEVVGAAAGVGDGNESRAGTGELRGDADGKEDKPKPRPTLDRAKEVLGGLRLREIWQGVRAKAPVMPGTGKPAASEQKQQQEGQEPPKITLRGLASIQSPTKAAVLYAPPVDQLGLLQAFCQRVRDVFREAELMIDDGRPLLLHATVVNTVYSKQKPGEGGGGKRRGGRGGRGGGGGWGRKRERLVFDATGFIERYEDVVWMEDVPIEKVAICKMGAKKVVVDGVEDGAYEVEAEVVF